METTSPPKVSVLMAVKNGEKYLREAVDSILAQTFTDFEFIIINDGSTDATAAILNDYSDDRIVLLRNQTNIGLTKSLNRGLEKVRGEYIARMDADDFSVTERLSLQTSCLDSNSRIGIVGGRAFFVGEEAQAIPYPEDPDFLKWCLCFYNPIAHPTVMFRRDLVRLAGCYNENYSVAQDYELWCRMCWSTRLTNLPQVLVRMNKHEGNITKIHADESVQSSLKIASNMMSRLINATMPQNIVACLHTSTRHWKNWLDVIQSALYLDLLYRGHEHTCELTPESRMLIINDRNKLYREMLQDNSSKILRIIINLLTLRN